jgi:hypothetical protein
VAPLIRAERLVKDFSRPMRKTGPLAGIRSLLTLQRVHTRAVDEVSFEVEPGEVIGYLGPNGAGKSTTIKMLTGVLVPTSGLVEVNGAVPWRDRKRNARNIGVVFGQRSQLWYDLPLRDSFEMIRKLYGIPDRDYHRSLAARPSSGTRTANRSSPRVRQPRTRASTVSLSAAGERRLRTGRRPTGSDPADTAAARPPQPCGSRSPATAPAASQSPSPTCPHRREGAESLPNPAL